MYNKNTILDLEIKLIDESLLRFSEYIKLLLYKENKSIFDILDFENDNIFMNPLFFSYFNEKNSSHNLDTILFGYQNEGSLPSINIATDEYGRVYLPNIGWLNTNFRNENLVLEKQENLILKKDNIQVDYNIEEIELIEGTNIELLKYPIPLLKKCFYNTDKEIIEVEIEEITKLNKDNLTKAYNIIKKYAPEQFELIQKCAPRCVIFNVDTYQRNSFADLAAHGVSFYNAYQEDYDEVFFIDDIAHQTGHVIFTNMISKEEDFFEIEKGTVIEVIKRPDGQLVENRDVEVIFHALYTYYTTFINLDACLNNDVFLGKQKHEALGRVCFYLGKCYRDLLLIDKPITNDEHSKSIFTNNGLILYNMIKDKWKEMYSKWGYLIKAFNMENQPYNFTYSKFIELNPIDEINN